jgi:hypothetical protein
LLIEDARPALRVSDFTAFRDAGFEVAYCTGPGGTRTACPLLRGEDCDVLDGADVVLHGLDPRCGVAAAVRWWHPEIPVVRTGPDCSVAGQVAAVRQALSETVAGQNDDRRDDDRS